MLLPYTTKPALYLIPNTIADEQWEYNFPEINRSVIHSLKYFIAEDSKRCRHLLSLAGYKDISQAIIEEYNEHYFHKNVEYLLNPINKGFSIGLISDAGMPVIADPGDEIVRIAHQKNIPIIPLIGPSSVMLAIMASGLSGNNFAFNGYLPIQTQERIRKIKELEQFSLNKKQAQFFIETPYRNQKLLTLLIQILHPETLLSVSCHLQTNTPIIITKINSEWKKTALPDIHKKPCIFGIMRVTHH